MNSVLYQFLNEPYERKREWMRAEQKIEDLRASMLPGAVQYDKDNVMVSADDGLVRYVEKLEPLERKAAELFTVYCRSRTQVEEALEALTKKQQKVMRMKYFGRLSNKRIAEVLGVSRREVMKLCDRAYDGLLLKVLCSPLKHDIL